MISNSVGFPPSTNFTVTVCSLTTTDAVANVGPDAVTDTVDDISANTAPALSPTPAPALLPTSPTKSVPSPTHVSALADAISGIVTNVTNRQRHRPPPSPN